MTAFSRSAADADAAPDLRDRLEMCRLGGVAVRRLERIGKRITELDGDVLDVMAPFLSTFVDFDARTRAGTWWERLLKTYVSYGVEDDVARVLASALDPTTQALVLEVIGDDAQASLVMDRLTTAMSQDPVLTSRLALWGRRLVGEGLGVVQRLLVDHPDIRALAEKALPTSAGPGDLQQRLFSVLTGEHTRRMDRLGLTA